MSTKKKTTFYLINKTLFSRKDTGLVMSKHASFDSAKNADDNLQTRIKKQCGNDCYVPTVIIESNKNFKKNTEVIASDY